MNFNSIKTAIYDNYITSSAVFKTIMAPHQTKKKLWFHKTIKNFKIDCAVKI